MSRDWCSLSHKNPNTEKSCPSPGWSLDQQWQRMSSNSSCQAVLRWLSQLLSDMLSQGDGGWEPKCREEPLGRRGRGKKRRMGLAGTEASGSLSSDEETDADVNASVAGLLSGRYAACLLPPPLPSSPMQYDKLTVCTQGIFMASIAVVNWKHRKISRMTCKCHHCNRYYGLPCDVKSRQCALKAFPWQALL